MTTKFDPALRDAARQLAALPIHGEPLTPEELLAYHLGELPEMEAEGVRERLVWDDTALAHLQALRNPDDESHTSLNREETEIAEDWGALQNLIARSPSEDVGPQLKSLPDRSTRPLPGAWSGWIRSPRPFQLLAAGLACIVLGLGWKLELAERRIAELVEPSANPTIATLMPVEFPKATRDPLVDSTLRFPQGSRQTLLLLNYAGFEPFGSYRGSLLVGPSESGQEGAVVHHFDRLERTADGGFHVILHREWIASGQYEFRLFGASDGVEEALASYRFVVAIEE